SLSTPARCATTRPEASRSTSRSRTQARWWCTSMALSARGINFKDGTDTTVAAVVNVGLDAIDVTISIPSTSFTRLNTLTTKGDIYVATGAATVVRLAVGSNGTVLKADSGQTAGVKWEAVKESELTFTDITTNDVSTTKHGFVPK